MWNGACYAALTFFRVFENVRKTQVREVSASNWFDPSSTLMMDADDEEVDAAASSVGALHINPFRRNGGAELARSP